MARMSTGGVLAARLGGALAIVVSLVLLARLAALDHVDGIAFGYLTFMAILGLSALVWPTKAGTLLVATILLFLAMIPLLIGGAGLLYIPSLILFLVGGGMQRKGKQTPPPAERRTSRTGSRTLGR